MWVNAWHMLNAAVPFGGYKQSGWGRERGHAALEGYLETKSVITDLGLTRRPAHRWSPRQRVIESVPSRSDTQVSRALYRSRPSDSRVRSASVGRDAPTPAF